MHNLRGNAIPAGPLSESDEIFCCLESVLLCKISALWVQKAGCKQLKIVKILNFWQKKFAPNGQILLSEFYKIRRGEGVPGPYCYAKLHSCGFINVGLQAPKSPKLVFFWYILPKRGISPSAIFTKFGMREGVPSRSQNVLNSLPCRHQSFRRMS